MKPVEYLCAAVLAGSVFVSAPAAQAAHFVFDVTVTKHDNVLLATPIQFQEVFNLPYSGTAPVTTIVDPVTQLGNVEATGFGTGAFGALNPLEQSVLDPLGVPTTAFADVQSQAFAAINNGILDPDYESEVGFIRLATNSDLLSGTLHRRDDFDVQILGQFNGPGSVPSLTSSALFDVLSGYGTFGYIVGHRLATQDYGTGEITYLARTDYQGTAIFNRAESSIPEPRVWTMMVAGFGGLGAGLRASRRRRAATRRAST
jgi:hypothetical protein